MMPALRIFALIGFVLAAQANADEFDLYTTSVLDKVPSGEGASQVERISLADLTKAPAVLSGTNSTLLVVRTDEGHWSKMVVGRALRKRGESEEPIVVIERYQTLRQDSENGRLAAGKNVYLFDGFHFNLDIGQVVPEHGGGDIEFHRQGDASGFIEASSKSKMYLVRKPLVSVASDAADAVSRGPVTAPDFSGKYRLVANGQWSGALTLKVSQTGEVTGTYLSDQTGRDYTVKGTVTTPSHHIRFAVELPVARQEFDGYLWTRGKNAMAGVTTLAERPFGFVAIRAGSELIPKDEE